MAGLLTEPERVDVRRFCGYAAHAPFGTIPEADYGRLETVLDRLAAEEVAVVRTVYLAVLPGLETGVVTAAGNLDTAAAAVWTRNPNEVRDRTALFNSKRRELCGFLGVAAGGGLRPSGSVVRA